MRLTGGSFRGRKIKASGMGSTSGHGALRATSSRVREAVFNIIGPAIDGAVFVDLYSGTGTMGMEAMSRGASKVFYVESDPARSRKFSETLDGCGCHARAVIVNKSAIEFLRKMQKEGIEADVFFLDPPYDSDELSVSLPFIAGAHVLAPDGVVLCEHPKGHDMPESEGPLVKQKTYRYGDTMISLYRMER